MNQPVPAVVEQFVALYRHFPLSEIRRDIDIAFIKQALEEHRGNQCHAARQLGMHRNTLARRMTELRIPSRYGRSEPRKRPSPARIARARVWGAA